MRIKSINKSELLQHSGISEIHNNLLDKIAELDKLNTEFKAKQEEHFLKTFMNILERMGNDLVLAQQAYRNIDLEAKREKYYLQLADQLNFFKNECFFLRKQNKQLKNEIQNIKLDNQMITNELKSLKTAFQRKSRELSHAKEANSNLKIKVKTFSLKEKDNLQSPEKLAIFTATEIYTNTAQLSEKKQEVAKRWLQTQRQNRTKPIAQSAQFSESSLPLQNDHKEVHHRYSKTPTLKFRSTKASSFCKGSEGQDEGNRSIKISNFLEQKP